MVLVDTSVWVAHLREPTAALNTVLLDGLVLIHPFVVGELACGNLRNREEFLERLGRLPRATEARHVEVLGLMSRHKLWGRGLGWTDAHLIASALLTNCRLWTLDKALAQAAGDCGATLFSRPRSQQASG